MYMHTIRLGLPLSIIQGSKKPKPNNNLSFGEYPLFAMTTHMYNDTISISNKFNRHWKLGPCPKLSSIYIRKIRLIPPNDDRFFSENAIYN
ncbi:hypothetical protein BLOT_005321 [Blomia tropicalis]|nr:hypothetical protein BLOT_005321 [Blomia tropicalis]